MTLTQQENNMHKTTTTSPFTNHPDSTTHEDAIPLQSQVITTENSILIEVRSRRGLLLAETFVEYRNAKVVIYTVYEDPRNTTCLIRNPVEAVRLAGEYRNAGA